MLLLTVISILSWTVIFQRFLAFRKAQKAYQKFEHYMHSGSELQRLYEYLMQKGGAVSGVESVFKAGFREFMRFAKNDKLTPALVHESAERAMRVALAKEEQNLEMHLPFLATVGSISVYIGLFGTVWGIMTAFRALGAMQQATLAMVAPGISEALIATALGLFASIPALYAYNRFSQHIEELTRNYDHLAEEFLGLLHRQLYSVC
jgi:biopolymer transport protein TolQ